MRRLGLGGTRPIAAGGLLDKLASDECIDGFVEPALLDAAQDGVHLNKLLGKRETQKRGTFLKDRHTDRRQSEVGQSGAGLVDGTNHSLPDRRRSSA